jgi:iron complex outermembrane receptor protein
MNATHSSYPGIRRLLLCGFLIYSATYAGAQVATTASGTSKDEDKDVVVLSPFQVTSTQDQGYVITNSGSALRTRQDLLDIPQSVQILSRDFIKDIGALDTAAVLQFAGAQARESGEFFTFRGQGLGYALIDGMADRTPYADNVFVDSYQVVKGPAAVFYPNTTLGGVVLKDTRKPLPTKRNTLAIRAFDYGMLRAEIDSTGPIGQIGDTKVSYRVTAAVQDGDSQWENVEDKRTVAHGALRFDLKNTTVILSLDKQLITRPANPTGVITPDGSIWQGGSRDKKGIIPPGTGETFDHTGVRAMIIQSFSPNWDARLIVGANNFTRKGTIVIPAYGANFQTRQVGLMNRFNNAAYEDYSLVAEVNGKYELLKRKNQSTFGLILNNQRSLNRFWLNPNFGGPNQPQKWVSMDNYDLNAITASVLYDRSAYPRPAVPGSRQVNYYGNAFFQQVVEVLPDRLSLIGGVSKYMNDTRVEANYAAIPLAASATNSWLNLHRYGFVLSITKNIRVYGLDSTTSLPPSAARTQDGSALKPASGKGKEIGVKVNLFDGRVFGNLGVFDYTTSGGSGGIGGFFPNGEAWVLVGGTRRSKGWDLDLAFKVTENWQLMGNYYESSGSTDDKGQAVLDSARSTWSFFTRYNVPKMRISFGGGANYTAGRNVTSASITYPTGQTKPPRMPVVDGTWTTAFINYTHNKHLSFSLNCVNVLDEDYPYGWQAAYLVDPAPPRSFSLTATYKF